MFADTIIALAAQETDEQAFRFRPSMAGPERCLRQTVYAGLDYPEKPLPGRTMLIFDDGNWHEELTMDWVRKMPGLLHSGQMEVKTPCGTGHIDFMYQDVDKTEYLVEHKAINCYTFAKYLAGEYPLDYFTQFSLYMWGIQQDDPSVNQGYLLIKNKNTAQYLEYHLEYDSETDMLTVHRVMCSSGELNVFGEMIENIVTDATRRFEQARELIDKKELPERQYYIRNDTQGWRCSYCAFGGECWKNFEEEFAQFVTENTLPETYNDNVLRWNESGHSVKEHGRTMAEIETEMQDIMFQRKIKQAFCKFSGKVFQLDLKLKTSNKMVKDKLDADQREAVAVAEKTLRGLKEKSQYLKLSIKEVKNDK